MTSEPRFLPNPSHHPAPRSTAARVGLALGVTAAALAGLAAANVYAAREAERRNPPRGRFITVDGVRLHCLEAGPRTGSADNAPPVVLIHGNVATADDFVISGLFDRLARNHRVVAIDRPGMGHSERPRGPHWPPAEQASLLRHAFDRLGIERPVVVGHSFGATVAIAMALDHPDAIGGILLLAGYYFPTARLDALLLAGPQTVPVLGDLLRYTLSPPLGAAMLPLVAKTVFAPMPVPDHFAERFPAALTVRPGQILASAQDGATMVPAAAAMQDRYGDLTMPVTIITGDGDLVVDAQAESIRLHHAIPHSVLHRVHGAGHMVHYADTALVAEAVDRLSVLSGTAT